MSGEAEYWSFPTNKEEFDNDDRISFSKLDNKYIAVQEDGTEYEFDEGLKRWIPIIDDALIQEHQKAYMAPGADEDESVQSQGKKRKKDSNDREDGNSNKPKNNKKQRPQQPQANKAVYVTGLPPDATVEEVAELFSRKCGVIAEEIDTGRPRVKLYKDAEGNFKGDALIVFFKPQSVDMAIMLLDDTEFRFGDPPGTPRMRVQAADTSYKKTKYDGGNGGDSAAGGNGNGGSDSKQRNQDKQKIIKKTQKLDAKLADWDDDDGPAASAAFPGAHSAAAARLFPDAKGGKWDKVVILRHMFTLEELDEDPAALLDIKEDIREECSKLGEVTNVVLFDQEEEGIVSVKFATAEAAEACVHLMHGRSFAGRTVEAFFATGKEKFKKSKGNGKGNDEDHDD